jgi:hypothetical protein
LDEASKSLDTIAFAGILLFEVGATSVTTMLFATVLSAALAAAMVTVEVCGAVEGAL